MRFKTLLLLWVMFSSFLSISFAIRAENVSKLSGNVALSSEYVWRGYSQTDEDPAISGGFDYAAENGFSVGVWGSNVGFAADADLELDLYASYHSETESGIGWRVGFLRYTYPGTKANMSGDLDWNEYNASLSYAIFTVGINLTNDVYGTGENGTYYTAAIEYGLPKDFSLNVGLGLYDYAAVIFTEKVEDLHIVISKNYAGLNIAVGYFDTNNAGNKFYGAKVATGRVVLSFSKAL